MSIGERISSLRKTQNVSQVQLAKALGVSRQAVSKWENDLAAPDTIRLIQIADLLGTDSEFLATGNHSMLKSPPTVITKIEKVENVTERIVEKPVEKIVEIERVVERKVEVPRFQKVFRVRYIRNPLEFAVVGILGVAIGIIIGLLF